jgi:hypothetical protein
MIDGGSVSVVVWYGWALHCYSAEAAGVGV